MDAHKIEKLETRLAKSEQAVRDMWERARNAESQRDAWAEKAAEAGQYIALNKALGDRLGVYMTKLAEAREVLKAVEWQVANYPDYEPECPSCEKLRALSGHASDCKLVKCLEGVND